MKLSFILPCYNVERYITDCLNSIYSQNLSEDDFEVICVNDCSTDGTRPIIADYSQKHSNLILIDHECNLTAGGARNTGIDYAKGEYIWFVDPDDLIKPNSAEELCRIMVERGLDVLFFNFDDVDERQCLLRRDRTYPNGGETWSGQEYIAKFFPGKMNAFGIVWRCLFRTRFLQDEDIRYPIMRKAQDVVFLWKVMLRAEKVSSVEKAYYNYRCNPYSVIHKQTEAKVAFSDRILRAYQIELMLHNDKVAILPSIKFDMVRSAEWCVNSNLMLLSRMPREELNLYYDEIINHRDAVDCVKHYMNRKNRLLFDDVFGRCYWILKAQLLCRMQTKKSRKS